MYRMDCLKVLLQRAIFIVFFGFILLFNSNMALGSDTKPHQKPKEIEIKIARMKGFPYNQA
jgi:hypothetical protein